MGVLSGQKRLWGIANAGELIPRRSTGAVFPTPYVGVDKAMTHSAVWACLRLRADLESTLPVDVYRYVDNVQVEMPKPRVMRFPGGERVSWNEWVYSSRMELDRSGNAIGIITAWDGNNLPYQIDLYPSAACAIKVRNDKIVEYNIGGTNYTPENIWHEKQYTVPGLHVGLSPVAYAAYTLGEYASVQQFVTSWFSSGATPRARLKNVERAVDQKEATIVKEAWRASQAMGEPFVHGSDWEYSLIQAEHASTDWVESKQYSAVDIARFFGCPSTLIDAAVSGENVTYTTMTERNLQFLVMNFGPAVTRREWAFTNGLVLQPRFVKFNTDALLRMAPTQRAEMFKTKIESRQLAPSEARAYDNLPPFTPAQMEEIDHFFPPKTAAPVVAPTQEGSDNG
jgi:HK97 family phage portal protein